MSSKFVVLVKISDDAGTVASEISPNVSSNPHTTGVDSVHAIQRITEYIQNSAIHGRGMNMVFWDTAVSATGTFTITSSNLTAGDTVSIGGVTLTADTDFSVGATALATAANLVTAVNAKTTLYGIVRAASAAGAASSAVVTFTAVVPGNVGNLIPLAKSATNGSVSGAYLTSGSQAHKNTLDAGLA